MTGVEFLLDLNRKQSAEYCSVDASLLREKYQEMHPTAISALKCMDGRLNLPVITHTPAGIIQPWRTIGGKFNLGWPHFGDLMTDWVNRSLHTKRDCLVLISYHFSKGDTHRGCRGFGYDTDNAVAYTKALKDQFETVYGKKHVVLYPVQIGIETDEDAIIVHGKNGSVLDIATLADPSLILGTLREMFPDMSSVMVADFAHLLEGNHTHVAETRASNRPIVDTEHKEWIIGIGRGYDWLHTPNIALLLGAYDFDLASTVRTAAEIVSSNLSEGRIEKKRGIVLMSSSPCWEPEGSMVWMQMREKSNALALLAKKAIQEHRPELMDSMEVLSGVVNMRTRFFHSQELQPSALQ